MAHPLDGAFLRLARAERHLQEATELLREWEAATKDKIVRDDNGQYRFDRFADIPVMMPVVVGDVIHNFRAALDYLAYELSLLDSNGLIRPARSSLLRTFERIPQIPIAVLKAVVRLI